MNEFLERSLNECFVESQKKYPKEFLELNFLKFLNPRCNLAENTLRNPRTKTLKKSLDENQKIPEGILHEFLKKMSKGIDKIQ